MYLYKCSNLFISSIVPIDMFSSSSELSELISFYSDKSFALSAKLAHFVLHDYRQYDMKHIFEGYLMMQSLYDNFTGLDMDCGWNVFNGEINETLLNTYKYLFQLYSKQ